VGLGASGWEGGLLGPLGSGTQGVLVIGGELENHSVHNILFVRAEEFTHCTEIDWYV